MNSLQQVREQLAELITAFRENHLNAGELDLQHFKGLVYAYGTLASIFEKEKELEQWEQRIRALEEAVYESEKSKTA